MLCSNCGATNGPSATFCGRCGQTLTPAQPVAAATPVATPPTTPIPTPTTATTPGYGTSPAVAATSRLAADPSPYRSYFRALLLWGAGLTIFGYVLILQYSSDVASSDGGSFSNSGDTAELVLGGIIAAVGGLLLVPGMIGWGIHASGLTRSRTAAASQPTVSEGPL